jgi:hypothetical protein
MIKLIPIYLALFLLTQSKVEPGNSVNFAPNTTPVIKLDAVNAVAEVNWPALKHLLVNSSNLKKIAGRDSVDYIGQVYYSTAYKTEGFERTAVKRIKSNNQWYFESFYKSSADSNLVRKIFFALYEALKKNIKENSQDDFILASSAKRSISESPMNWLVQWTLATNYKTLPAGIGKPRIALMLTGMKNAFKKNAMEYTIKIYLSGEKIEYDFFTWDKPL